MAKKVKTAGELAQIMGARVSEKTDKFLSTPSYALNLMMGGGLPLNRITEIMAEQGSGKSTLCYQLLRQAYDDGMVPILVDAEHAADEPRLAKFGLRPYGAMDDTYEHLEENLIWIRPGSPGFETYSIEDMFAGIEKMLDSSSDLSLFVVIDSIPSLKSDAALKRAPGSKVQPATEARAWREWFPIWLQRCSHRCSLVGINHITSNIPMGFVPAGTPDKTSPGGTGWKHYASTRITISGGKRIKEGDEVVGKIVTFSTDKIRTAPPYQKTRVHIYFGNPDLSPEEDFAGVHDGRTSLEHLDSRGVVKKAGSYKKIKAGDLELSWQTAEEWDKLFDEHREAIWQLMADHHYKTVQSQVATQKESIQDMINAAGRSEGTPTPPPPPPPPPSI